MPFLQHLLFHSPIWRKFDVAVSFIPKSHNLLLLNIPNPHFFLFTTIGMPRSKNDGAANTMPSSFEHCWVSTEFDIVKCFTPPQNISEKSHTPTLTEPDNSWS